MNKTVLIILGVLLLLIIMVIIMVNSVIYLKKRVERSKSTIDVFLKKRFDLIPNLVECVKGYVKYEQETLTKITELRTQYNNNMTETAGKELNNHYQNLLALVEQYPNIKASENFLKLQKDLTKVEDEIAASRRLFINDITNYNTKINSVPSNIIANMMGYKEFEYPELESQEIKINFDQK